MRGNARWTAAAVMMDGGGEIAMDVSSSNSVAAQWAAGRQSNCDGQWDGSDVMDGRHNGQQTIAANREVAQSEAMQDGLQQQSG